MQCIHDLSPRYLPTLLRAHAQEYAVRSTYVLSVMYANSSTDGGLISSYLRREKH
jgi:hypothetical protein